MSSPSPSTPTPPSISSVPVSITSHTVLHNCRPLPEDIATLPEDETGCQYCGVSYLLLSKYDKMVTHVGSLEKDLEVLRSYAKSYPEAVSKSQDLEMQLKLSKEEMDSIKKELESTKSENSTNIRALHELQLRYTRITHDMENMMKRSMWTQESQSTQIKTLTRVLQDAHSQLGSYKKELRALKNQVVFTFKDQFGGTLSNISAELYKSLPEFLENRTKTMVNALNAKHGIVVGALKSEVEELKDYLKDSENRYNGLMKDMNQLREEYEGYIASQQSSSTTLTNRCNELQNEVETLRTKLTSVEKERDAHQLGERQAIEKWRGLEINIQNTSSSNQQTISSLQQQNAQLQQTLSNLQSQFDKEKATWETTTSTSSATISQTTRTLQTKDAQIHELNNSLRELRTTVHSMREERQKTIEAHQSRVQQLQDKYIQMLSDKEKEQESVLKERLLKEFESEKAELLQAQKHIYQKQMSDVKGALQAQLDAARLSRDHAAVDHTRKLTQVEKEWGAKYTKAQDEILELRSKLASLETTLTAEREKASKALLANSNNSSSLSNAEIESLKIEVGRSKAEISFLKETIRMECEERMTLLAQLDGLRRGLPGAGAAAGMGPPAGGGGQASPSRASMGSAGKLPSLKSMKGMKGGNRDEEPKPNTVEKDPEMSLYQSMATAAALKKSAKLRPLSSNGRKW
ncbi:hypothetical protein HDV05_003448 [Chytridiales sp. JEL 0842]|nr:hypothetical protein HDV05_003448 [Chytridiales sp. JEL 0842]